MEEAHHIEWIEIIADKKSYRKFLLPGDAPEAEFCVEAEKYRREGILQPARSLEKEASQKKLT